MVTSAPLSRNVNSRLPLSIILPSVGHADAVNGELAGENDTESRLAALYMVSKADAGWLLIFTIRMERTAHSGEDYRKLEQNNLTYPH